MRITEHRERARGVADLLLYDSLIEDGILLQQDGSLMAAWSYRGPDTMSASAGEMEALSARFNSVLRLGSGWMVQCDAIRAEAPGYPDFGTFPDPVTRLIDDERRQQFMAEGAHFESEYFLALTYLPPVEAEEKVKGWMFEGRSRARSQTARQILDRFKSRMEAFENIFGQLFRIEQLHRVTAPDGSTFHDGLLRYVHRCVETTRDLYGAVKGQDRWKGAFTMAVNPPTDERTARVNPLGLYVTNASWTKVF
jgi:type IV secretion system protein TrbE